MKGLYVIPCNKIGGAENVFNSVVDLRSGNIEIGCTGFYFALALITNCRSSEFRRHQS